MHTAGYTVGRMEMGAATMEVLKELTTESSYHPEIPLLHTSPKEMKSAPHKSMCTSMFILSLFILSKILSVNQWIKKLAYMYNKMLFRL